MLEAIASFQEMIAGVDLTGLYQNSDVYKYVLLAAQTILGVDSTELNQISDMCRYVLLAT